MKKLTKEEIINKRKEYLMPCVATFYDEPLCLDHGKGEWLYDIDGNKYLDWYAGIMVAVSGYSNSKISNAVKDQVEKLQHTSTFFLNQPIVDLAEKLAQITPGKLKQSFFVNSGSEAVEGAVELAQAYTGNNTIIGLTHGYHGRTVLTRSLTSHFMWRTSPVNISNIYYTPNAYCYRCPFNASPGNCNMECAKYLEEVILSESNGKIGAVVAETIQGIGGVIIPPPDYFKVLSKICRKYGGLLIIDEVQTGFGRTGKWFAIEDYGVEPDIMCMAKGLANGFPIGAYITREEIAKKFEGLNVSTFGGNPVSCRAGVANIEYIEENGSIENSLKMGEILREKFFEMKDKYPIIGDVRGKGLFWGLELVKDRKTKEPAPEAAGQIEQFCRDEKLIIGSSGRYFQTLRIGPPLNISKNSIEQGLEILDRAFSKIK